MYLIRQVAVLFKKIKKFCRYPLRQPQFSFIYNVFVYFFIISSPELKAQGELIVRDSSRRPSVRACVRPFTLSNMNISETSLPIIIKFHQEHHWGRGLTALGFG